MARVVFYDPYLEVLGGGEKVVLTILEDVAQRTRHEVVVMSPHRPQVERWRRLHVHVEPQRIQWRRAGHLSASVLSARADLFVALTNHFPPWSLARRSAVIVQFPYADLHGPGLVAKARRGERRRRVSSYDSVVCYSQFVARTVYERMEVRDPIVLPPPVDIPAGGPAVQKEAKVLAVGRFFPAADANNKKHAVLIDAWRRLAATSAAEGWEFHLAGGLHADAASGRHLEQLRERARGLAVQFHPNAEVDELEDLYRRSALFWHAAGFGETLPERLEHFGITTVEAMAHACVPVVVALGGQLEIVTDCRNGRLWTSVEELVSVTSELMRDPTQVALLAAEAAVSAPRFSKQHFLDAVRAEILTPAGVD